MAARVGVIAVRDIGVEAFLAAFPMLGSSTPSRSEGWTWASFSLFGTSGLVGPTAESALRELGKPALQAWTEDGALWTLAVYPVTRKVFRHVHRLRYHDVAAGREKPKKSVTLRRYIDQCESDLAADYRYAGPLPEGPIARAMGEHLRARALSLSDALAACGLKHDRTAVRDALTGASVTEEERAWDVGNLPRLLDAIGLGGAFPGWREEIENEREAASKRQVLDAAARLAPPDDLVRPILDRLGAAGPAAEIRGGPVTVSPATLWSLPWSCESEVEIGFVARPSRAIRLRAPRSLEHLSVIERDGEWRIGHPWTGVGQRERTFKALATMFAALPNGSVLEMVSATLPEREGETPVAAGDMRFRGVVERGRWKLTHAHPATTATALKEALRIFAAIPGRTPFPTRNRAEGEAIAALGREAGHFGAEAKDQPVVSARGITVKARPWRHYLAMCVFRHRFAEGPWDTRSAQAAEQASSAEFDAMLGTIGETFSRQFAAPRGEELVFEGRRSAFRRADIFQVEARLNLADLFRRLYPAHDPGASVDLSRAVTLVDQAMTRKGMVSLGDMVCEAFGEVVIRGYAREAGDVYGLTYAGTLGQFVYEFNTRFSDGSTITTSIHHGENRKDLKFHHAQFPNAPVEELLDHHLASVDKRTTEKVKPVPHPMALETLAERIDDFLVKTAA